MSFQCTLQFTFKCTSQFFIPICITHIRFYPHANVFFCEIRPWSGWWYVFQRFVLTRCAACLNFECCFFVSVIKVSSARSNAATSVKKADGAVCKLWPMSMLVFIYMSINISRTYWKSNDSFTLCLRSVSY